MDHASRLDEMRREILREMGEIGKMRRGTVNEQFLKVLQKDGSSTLRGPYFLYSRTEKGKSISQRIQFEEVARYQEETEHCRTFKDLANRYVLVCEELADLPEVEQKKKQRTRKTKG